MRPIDVPVAYKRKVSIMVSEEYQTLLRPYLVTAFTSVEWPTGFTPRLLLAVKLHKQAVKQVHHDHGIADPRTKNPDMLKIIETFAPVPEAIVISFGS